MPKAPLHTVVWSAADQCYWISIHNQPAGRLRPDDDAALQRWLASQTAFVFHGASGRLNVHQEARPRGGRYWYAYGVSRQGKRKRYLGRTEDVTAARLEQIAGELTQSQAQVPAAISMSTDADTRTAPASVPLLFTKLIRPRAPAALVVRERLLRQLDSVLSHRLTLLSAGGGWGKTSLLSQWASQHLHPVAWISLDLLDNDLTRFWVALISALQTCIPSVGAVAIGMLQSAERPSSRVILTTLLNDLAAMPAPTPIVLVLDDYHVIDDRAIHESMAFLLEHLPSHLHIVLATRSDPDLPLARWRVRGELLELRMGDLRFSETETATFFKQALGEGLGDDAVRSLQRRTEGWVAGLQLAALALRHQADRAAFVEAFTGSHRYLFDYVREEILARHAPPVQRFLLQVAVPRRINAALCAVLTEHPNSQAMLEQLEANNLFLEPLDAERRWYRLHDLFREVLLARLQAIEPELVPRLHQRAARWYAEQGELREATAHALAAHDFTAALDLIERAAPQLWLRGEAQMVHAWLHALPDDIFWRGVRLALDAALQLPEALRPTDTAAFSRVQIQVEHTLARVEAGLRTQQALRLRETEAALLRRRLRLLRALIEMRAIVQQGDIARLRLLAEETVRLSEHDTVNWRLMALSLMFWLVFTFRQEEPRLIPLLLNVKAQAIEAGEHVAAIRAMAYLAHLYGHGGQLRQFEQECLEGLAFAKRVGVHTVALANMHLNLAETYYAWNRLQEAAESLHAGLQIAQAWEHTDLLLWGYTQLARLELARDDMVAMDRAIQQAEEVVQREQFMHWAPTVTAARVRYWLATGDQERAVRWSVQIELDQRTLTHAQDAVVFAQVRVALARQHYVQALETLERFATRLDQPGHIPITIEFLTLYLVALHLAAKRAQARHVAARLLSLTEPEDHVRVYLELGEPMRRALQGLYDTPRDEDDALPPRAAAFIAKLLAIFDQGSGIRDQGSGALRPAPDPQPLAPLLEPLTQREQEVLRLLVAGASNSEIASELVISLATVKKHVSNILGKLGVANRVQAIAHARPHLEEQNATT
jgi:LuxR family transcriptional regulator, maltose regulon positive regulatory protein